MRSDYKVYNIKDVLSKGKIELLDEVRNFKQIKTAESSGLFIAGGFVRYLLSPFDGGHRYGDIDLFLTKSSKLNFLNDLSDNNNNFLRSQRGPFAINHYVTNGFRNEKIQYVDHPALIKDSIYNTLDSFDLVNCKAAIDNEKIIIHKDLMDLDDRNILKISNNVGPLLLKRVIKYARFYGFNQIDPNSVDLINDWFLNAKSEFKDNKIHDNHELHIASSVESVKEFVLNINSIKNIDPNDITNVMFFLGNFRVTENIWENYDENGFKGRRVVKSIETDPIARLYGSQNSCNLSN
jgi:hypothetical protein